MSDSVAQAVTFTADDVTRRRGARLGHGDLHRPAHHKAGDNKTGDKTCDKTCDTAAAAAATATGYDLVGSDGGRVRLRRPRRHRWLLRLAPEPPRHPEGSRSWAWCPRPRTRATSWWGPTAGSSPSATPPSWALSPRRRSCPPSRSPASWPPTQTGATSWSDATAGSSPSGQSRSWAPCRRGGVSVDNIIGIAATPSGNGYWLISATGTVYAFGSAQKFGTVRGTSSPVSAIAGTPTGGGYWITTQNGAVYAFGNAQELRHTAGPLRPAGPPGDRHRAHRRAQAATGCSAPTAGSSPSATRRSSARCRASQCTSRTSWVRCRRRRRGEEPSRPTGGPYGGGATR